MSEKHIIRKVSRGRQNRVTIPKNWLGDYVLLRPLNIGNVFKERRRYTR